MFAARSHSYITMVAALHWEPIGGLYQRHRAHFRNGALIPRVGLYDEDSGEMFSRKEEVPDGDV